MPSKKPVKKVKNYTVVQANDLIRNKKDFSLWELRVFALLASHVKKEDDDFQTYRFRIKDLLDLFETKSNNLYEELKNIPEKLHAKIIKIPYEDTKGKKRIRRYNLISMSDVPDGENIDEGEYIELRFDKDLKPLMLSLGKHFTVYKFYNILKLRSPYIFQLYELLKSEEYKGSENIDISLVEFMEILQIPKSYKYGNIRQRILNPAQKQFKEHTDIIFQYEPVKGRGGKIVKLRFRIFKNEKGEILELKEKGESVEIKDSVVFDEMYDLVKKWMEKGTLRRLINSHPEEQVRKAIDYTLKRIAKGDVIGNVVGHIVALSKQTMLFDSVDSKKIQAQKKRVKKESTTQRKEELGAEKNRLSTEWMGKEDAIIEALFLEQPGIKEKMISLAKESRFSYYNEELTHEDNLQNAIFKAAFRNTVKKHFSIRFEALEKHYKSKIKSIEITLNML